MQPLFVADQTDGRRFGIFEPNAVHAGVGGFMEQAREFFGGVAGGNPSGRMLEMQLRPASVQACG